jgi:hypothetical protein
MKRSFADFTEYHWLGVTLLQVVIGIAVLSVNGELP